MLLALAFVLVVIWLLCVVVFKVTVAFVHLLLFFAAIALIAYFVRGRAPRPGTGPRV